MSINANACDDDKKESGFILDCVKKLILTVSLNMAKILIVSTAQPHSFFSVFGCYKWEKIRLIKVKLDIKKNQDIRVIPQCP